MEGWQHDSAMAQESFRVWRGLEMFGGDCVIDLKLYNEPWAFDEFMHLDTLKKLVSESQSFDMQSKMSKMSRMLKGFQLPERDLEAQRKLVPEIYGKIMSGAIQNLGLSWQDIKDSSGAKIGKNDQKEQMQNDQNQRIAT